MTARRARHHRYAAGRSRRAAGIDAGLTPRIDGLARRRPAARSSSISHRPGAADAGLARDDPHRTPPGEPRRFAPTTAFVCRRECHHRRGVWRRRIRDRSVHRRLSAERRTGIGRGFTHFDDEFVKSGRERATGRRCRRPRCRLAARAGRRRAGAGATLRLAAPLRSSHAVRATGRVRHRASGAEPYDGEVAYTDAALGQLFDALESAMGILDRTLIVIVADHGECAWRARRAHPRHVHLRLDHPRAADRPRADDRRLPTAPTVIQDVVETADIAPTLARWRSCPRRSGLDGIDLVR